ncbi:DUF2933 domain-containing protein [Pelosinus baikalensis]|uniref:DUF2933 domain-containing protein n=1 Tax=Pelosinus baikalensis TaxID=2892015 RepID=A0ABS8HXG0_9FIRM|nr:DUF2933 domain-containing protein [Pelosinus baikalensis]MCC5467851.1 DUF2933 domain-containing protein [Pelosinus baikalensis]
MEQSKQVPLAKGQGPSHVQHQGCGGGWKHMVMMMVCCLAPLGLVLLLKQNGYDGSANYLVLLMCPLMHFVMMRSMGKKAEGEKQSS